MAKPSPLMLQQVLDAAGCAPGDAVVVGDSYVEDVSMAAGVGCATVWVLARPDRESAHAAAVLTGGSPAPTATVAAIGGRDAGPGRRPVTAA